MILFYSFIYSEESQTLSLQWDPLRSHAKSDWNQAKVKWRPMVSILESLLLVLDVSDILRIVGSSSSWKNNGHCSFLFFFQGKSSAFFLVNMDHIGYYFSEIPFLFCIASSQFCICWCLCTESMLNCFVSKLFPGKKKKRKTLQVCLSDFSGTYGSLKSYIQAKVSLLLRAIQGKCDTEEFTKKTNSHLRTKVPFASQFLHKSWYHHTPLTLLLEKIDKF